jgi:hypothetical protein
MNGEWRTDDDPARSRFLLTVRKVGHRLVRCGKRDLARLCIGR